MGHLQFFLWFLVFAVNLTAVILNFRFLRKGSTRFLRLHFVLLVCIALGILLRFVFTYFHLVSDPLDTDAFYTVKYCLDAFIIWLLLQISWAACSTREPGSIRLFHLAVATAFAVGAIVWPGRNHSLQRSVTYIFTAGYAPVVFFLRVHALDRSRFRNSLLTAVILCCSSLVLIALSYIFLPRLINRIGFFLYLVFVLTWDAAAFIFLKGASVARQDGTFYMERLSSREREILDLVLDGKANKTIAKQLYISPHTVKRHIANICSKLEVRSKLELASLFTDNG